MKETQSLQIAKQFLGKEVEVTIDRPLGSKHPRHDFIYEVNYGFVEGVQSSDGAELDVYYLGINEPIKKAKGICIAIAHRNDDDDDNLIVVPEGASMTDEEIMLAISFQEKWFDTEMVRE